MPRKEGQFLVEDFFINNGGLNTADSPFVVQPSQCTGGKNFDYRKRGGIQKRFGHTPLNTSANADLRPLGLALWDKPTATRFVLRAAGTHLQAFDTNAYTFTNLSEDTTAAATALLPGSSTIPVISQMFNTSNAGTLWNCGGGLANGLYGAYSATKATFNGVAAPTASAFTATGSTSGGTLPTGSYVYSLAFRKASTKAQSNCVIEATGNVASGTTGSVALAWTLTNNDTTKYDKIEIYRSSVNGSAGFTAGQWVAEVASTATSYTDVGTSLNTSVNVARANNTILDRSQLPAGQTYNALTLFKRRLVTASGSTVSFSDVNQDEAWPTYQTITIPSGGDITGLAVVGLTSPLSTDIDEALCVFKQRELWVITGDGVIASGSILPNWSLKYVSSAGVSGQSSIVAADGQLFWVNYRGFYFWNGAGKPLYISKGIEDKFQLSGDIDKSKLNIAWGMYTPGRGELQWTLSSKTYGTNQYVLKLDLNATFSTFNRQQDLLGNIQIEGAFTPDVLPTPMYAGVGFIQGTSSTEETYYYGDAAGFIYSGYLSALDGTATVDMEYATPYLVLGTPGQAKRIHKVVAWVLDKGNYNLNLSFWSDFKYKASDSSSRNVAISPVSAQVQGFLWGSAKWGAGTKWGAFASRTRPVIFNLSDYNAEGDCVRMQFAQYGSQYQCLLYGFSVYYTEIATRK